LNLWWILNKYLWFHTLKSGKIEQKGGLTMTPKNWTLLVIAASERKPLQPVHLQKSLFLLSKYLTPEQLGVDAFYEFQNYDYGPFCSDIYFDAEHLEDENLVHIDIPSGLSYRLYSATPDGKTEAERLRTALRPNVREYLDRVVKWATSLSFRQIVSQIYREFPETKVNSIFRR
jgi:hypothetical protein